MKKLFLFHGSQHIIKKPAMSLGKEYNDYGKGFYCTQEIEAAKEWACKQNTDGFVSKYEIDISGLSILYLTDGKYNILNWIALLLKNRNFSLTTEISISAKEFIINNFGLDTSEYDIVVGYRADNSYFSYAQLFVENGLSVKSLGKAMSLGDLGVQTVLISQKAFDAIRFISSEPVLKEKYYPIFSARDNKAREEYKTQIKRTAFNANDIFIMDIMRGDVNKDDLRI